jgi:nicotinamidase/pyrazinamidase
MRLLAGDALVIVDLQCDFCSGGALPIAGADDIVPTINDLIQEAFAAHALIVASRDWHPPDHSSFLGYGGDWPAHCVQGSDGARFHPALHLPDGALIISKGQSAGKDQYSAFNATGLADELRRRGVKRVLICGLAQDVCVRASALDAVERGIRDAYPIVRHPAGNACSWRRSGYGDGSRGRDHGRRLTGRSPRKPRCRNISSRGDSSLGIVG